MSNIRSLQEHSYVVKVFLGLALVVFSPPFFYVALAQSSMSAGLVFAAFLLAVVFFRFLRKIRFQFSAIFFLLAFALHFLVSSSSQEFIELEKSLYSFLVLLLMIGSSWLFAKYLESVPAIFLKNAIVLFSVFGVFLGVFSILFKPSFGGYQDFSKAVFPFSEPSHYAISLSGLFVAGVVLVERLWFRGLMALLIIALGAALPSVSLVVCGIFLIVFLVRSPVHLIFSVFFAGFVVTLLGSALDYAYFSDRLVFDGGSDNLSSLVYMQGWEDAARSLTLTNGLGVGFQNSTSLTSGDYGERIYDIVGFYKNKEDYGFLAAKLCVELGVLGVLIIGLYGRYALLTFRFLWNFARLRSRFEREMGVNSVLGCSLVVGFFLEMFVRGVGYFSPGTFLFFLGFFLVRVRRKGYSFGIY